MTNHVRFADCTAIRLLTPLAFLIACVASSSVANAGVLAGSGNFGSHHYELYSDPGVTWSAADTAASGLTFNGVSGHLATITSLGEDSFINSLGITAGLNEMWVGGSQLLNQSGAGVGWSWVNGEGSIDGTNAGPGYANWLGGEPNDAPGAVENNDENFLAVRLGGNFGWNDEGHLGNIVGYVVEYDDAPVPEPTSIAIFGIGALGLVVGGMRRRKQKQSA